MKPQNLPTTVSDRFFRSFCPDPTVIYDLAALYNSYNSRFFSGDLPELKRVVKKVKGKEVVCYPDLKWDGRLRSKTYGTYTPAPRPGNGKIRLSRSIASKPVKLKSTLVHEMLHKWLDLKGLDDGVKGHGPEFIRFAKQINLTCQADGIPIRVNFFGKPITKEAALFQCGFIGSTVYSVEDLDIARSLEGAVEFAFDGNGKFSY